MVNSPWTQMWVHPRETIRAIVKENPRQKFAILSFLYGLPTLMNLAQSLSLGAKVNYLYIILGCLILAAFVGMLGITIVSGLLKWTGKWIGGKASYIDLRAAVSWSNVTNIVTSAILLIQAFIFGQYFFLETFPTMHFVGGLQAMMLIFVLVQLVVSIWSIFILCKAVGEVQGFSAWKGLLNIIIPLIIVIAAVWILMLILGPSMGMQPA